MEMLWWLGASVIWAVWAVLSWLLVQLFWLLLWSALPIGIAAVLCVLAAERLLGKGLVRSWVRAQALAIAERARRHAGRALVALCTVPARVMLWFVIFALWHAVLNLWRTPRWTPWARAWRCRWGFA
jgi:hypothetical protein